MKIKKGDRVRVLSGKDRGKEGVVMRALPSEGKVIVDGVNTAKRHQKPTRMDQSGGIVNKDMPIDVSNVAVIDPSDGKPTRVGYRLDADGRKTRISRRTGTEIPERGDK
jgi:large subunit ribosomal protein L24